MADKYDGIMEETEETMFMDDGDDGFVLDMEEQEEESTFEPVPKGIYPVVVENVEFKTSSNGNPMLVATLTIPESFGEFGNRKFWLNMVLNNNFGKTMLKQFLVRTGATEVLRDAGIELSKFNPKHFAEYGYGLNLECRVQVVVGSYNGKANNQVKQILPPADMDDEI